MKKYNLNFQKKILQFKFGLLLLKIKFQSTDNIQRKQTFENPIDTLVTSSPSFILDHSTSCPVIARVANLSFNPSVAKSSFIISSVAKSSFISRVAKSCFIFKVAKWQFDYETATTSISVSGITASLPAQLTPVLPSWDRISKKADTQCKQFQFWQWVRKEKFGLILQSVNPDGHNNYPDQSIDAPIC